jgi:predicted helicase
MSDGIFPVQPFVGRTQEIDLLDGLVDHIHDRGAALIIDGEADMPQDPQETFAYRLGNRSALEWVIDQYQVSTDARGGITSDPNRADDPQYIVRLVKQVVSVETVRLVGVLEKQVLLDSAVNE